jgi:hypothetical protein
MLLVAFVCTCAPRGDLVFAGQQNQRKTLRIDGLPEAFAVEAVHGLMQSIFSRERDVVVYADSLFQDNQSKVIAFIVRVSCDKMLDVPDLTKFKPEAENVVKKQFALYSNNVLAVGSLLRRDNADGKGIHATIVKDLSVDKQEAKSHYLCYIEVWY